MTTTYGSWEPTPRWLQWLGCSTMRRRIYASWMIGGGFDGWEYYHQRRPSLADERGEPRPFPDGIWQ